MSNKQVITEQNGSRRNICRSLMPVRNNSIRGASMNHSMMPHKLVDSTNLGNASTHAKTMPKTLTVPASLIVVLYRQGQ